MTGVAAAAVDFCDRRADLRRNRVRLHRRRCPRRSRSSSEPAVDFDPRAASGSGRRARPTSRPAPRATDHRSCFGRHASCIARQTREGPRRPNAPSSGRLQKFFAIAMKSRIRLESPAAGACRAAVGQIRLLDLRPSGRITGRPSALKKSRDHKGNGDSRVKTGTSATIIVRPARRARKADESPSTHIGDPRGEVRVHRIVLSERRERRHHQVVNEIEHDRHRDAEDSPFLAKRGGERQRDEHRDEGREGIGQLLSQRQFQKCERLSALARLRHRRFDILLQRLRIRRRRVAADRIDELIDRLAERQRHVERDDARGAAVDFARRFERREAGVDHVEVRAR